MLCVSSFGNPHAVAIAVIECDGGKKRTKKSADIRARFFLFARKSSWPAIIGSEKLAVQ
jgi:hypothetical protein